MVLHLNLSQFHIESKGDRFVLGVKGTGLCSEGELILDRSTCKKACKILKVPEKQILGDFKCYKDRHGNCYQNGHNGDGAFMICKKSDLSKGKIKKE